MAADSKASFLGSISPWSLSRTASPAPKAAEIEKGKRDSLQKSSGEDHAVSFRPPPNLRRYPKDCPPLKVRWFYAVDVPKRKPFAVDPPDVKAAPTPKKLVAFSANDSQCIETAFQRLARDESVDQAARPSAGLTTTKVPVNEDYLFNVDIEQRELEPAYWLGPVYDVRRGSWFYQDTLRPCEENLANQLEEGYLKLAPWCKTNLQAPRASSQPRSRPNPLVVEDSRGDEATLTTPNTPKQALREEQDLNTEFPKTYRLFGTYMNTTVTYQDSATALLNSDDFMSRLNSTVYGRLGGMGGTKVVRGFNETGNPVESKLDDISSAKDTRRRSMPPPSTGDTETKTNDKSSSETKDSASNQPRRTALERQLSSLAGEADAQSSEDLAEEARLQEEKEMEDSRETNANEQSREIDHLVLVTHGIGQRLGLRLDSVNFIHDVNILRKAMKAVYASAPDLQALNAPTNDMPNNCRIQVLPICWRHLLDFPKQNVRQSRKEADISDKDNIDEDEYPSLADITVDGVPAVRNLITDLAMDILLYQSAYREHIAGVVQRECNRVFKLFKERNPNFSGRVSMLGHSLGSAIVFDILCRQKEDHATGTRRGVSSRTSKDMPAEQRDLQLDFDCENFFCIGSPIALFQMLKGCTISARSSPGGAPAESPFDPDLRQNDPFGQVIDLKVGPGPITQSSFLPVTTSSPKCAELFNIFHPTDPIAYRQEPLISPAMASLKPQPLPYTKKGLFDVPGISNIGARMGQSVGSIWYNFTSGMASGLINRSLGLTGAEQALPQDLGTSKVVGSATGRGSKSDSAMEKDGSSISIPVSDSKKQQALAEAAKSVDPQNPQTLIDAEMDTLYAGFQKRRNSQSSKRSEAADEKTDQEAAERACKLKREEAKVRALNSNGRVDYSIQEGVFDISLIASIASHLSYWADEDVNHFMIGQMLKRGGKERTTNTNTNT